MCFKGESMTANPSQKPLRSFGRRNGRKMHGARAARMESMLPAVQVCVQEGKPLAPAELFADNRPLWLEIGFGGGEHLAGLAKAHPDIGFVGCEPFMNGVSRLLGLMEEEDLKNIKILADDARLLLAALPEQTVERVYILYPDPWPKVRHHKRRIVQPNLLDMLARVLKPGGVVQLATDHEGYANQMLEVFLADTRFMWTAKTCKDWQAPPEGWVVTRYEEKCLEGTPPAYLRFIKV